MRSVYLTMRIVEALTSLASKDFSNNFQIVCWVFPKSIHILLHFPPKILKPLTLPIIKHKQLKTCNTYACATTYIILKEVEERMKEK